MSQAAAVKDSAMATPVQVGSFVTGQHSPSEGACLASICPFCRREISTFNPQRSINQR